MYNSFCYYCCMYNKTGSNDNFASGPQQYCCCCSLPVEARQVHYPNTIQTSRIDSKRKFKELSNIFSSLKNDHDFHPPPYFQRAHLIPIVGVAKRGVNYLVRGDVQRQHPLLERLCGLVALCRRTFGSERHRYAVAWPK